MTSRKADFWVAWHSGYLPDFQFPEPGMPSHHPPWRSDILLRRGIFVAGIISAAIIPCRSVIFNSYTAKVQSL